MVTTLAKGYHALGAVDGRLLAFRGQSADVFDFAALGASVSASATPVVLSDLGKTERVLSFKLDEWSLLYCYSLEGTARIVQLNWSEGAASVTEVWSGHVMTDAQAVSGVALHDEYLIFAYDPLTGKLQLISLTP